MSYNLFNKTYFENEDNLDLKEILSKFYRNFKFTENKNSIEDGIPFLPVEAINLIYEQQDSLQSNEQWEEIYRKCVSPINPDFCFSKTITKISKDQVLETEEVIQCYLILKSYCNLKNQVFIPNTEGVPIDNINRWFKDWFKECETLFDFKNLDLITYKHKDLKPIDHKIQETQKEIRNSLSKCSKEWQANDLLQQNDFDVLDERYVLPVRSDRYSSNLGRIIHRSKTGNTLFIEPHTLRFISNKLEELKAELEREVFKIFRRLSLVLREHTKEVQKIFHYILTLDATYGRLKVSLLYGLTRPIIDLSAPFVLENLFHPLLDDPVKNTVILKNNSNGLLISGPNTGGKTVLLKSLALCVVLPHLGFKVPASHASLPFYKNAFFMSHDNQSLIDGLSSFSSEAIDYLKTVNELQDHSSVIFIDEIFNTTSSLEASQLAIALIKEISHRKATTFISSHHETLKEKVFESQLLESGHMGFKRGVNTPTYIFHHGAPGRSFAKEVFLSLEKEILNFPDITRWLENDKHSTISQQETIQNLDEIKESSIKVKTEYESLVKVLNQERDNLKNLLVVEKKNLQDEYEKKWTHLKKEILDLTERIKKGEIRNIVKVSNELLKHKKQLTFDKTRNNQNNQENMREGEPRVGDSVWIFSLNKTGKIIKINKNKAYVETGKIKLWANVSDLNLTREDTSEKTNHKVKINIEKNNDNRGLKFDARGMRREEFLQKAEQYIFDILNGDVPFVDIIHGHGNGILKKSLFELLKTYRNEVKHSFMEGNMGTTRIELID